MARPLTNSRPTTDNKELKTRDGFVPVSPYPCSCSPQPRTGSVTPRVEVGREPRLAHGTWRQHHRSRSCTPSHPSPLAAGSPTRPPRPHRRARARAPASSRIRRRPSPVRRQQSEIRAEGRPVHLRRPAWQAPPSPRARSPPRPRSSPRRCRSSRGRVARSWPSASAALTQPRLGSSAPLRWDSRSPRSASCALPSGLAPDLLCTDPHYLPP